MDWLTFFSSIIPTMAWPTTVIVLFFMVKSDLPKIARSLRKFKYKDVEFEFVDAAKAVAEEAKGNLPEALNVGIDGVSSDDMQDDLKAIADLSPRAAILEAWVKVEAAAADVISKKGIDKSTRYVGPARLRDSLQKANILNKRQLHVFEQLRHLRNEAVHVHDAEFTPAAVANYIESATLTVSFLENRVNDL